MTGIFSALCAVAVPVGGPLQGRAEFVGVPSALRILVFPHIGPYVTPHGRLSQWAGPRRGAQAGVGHGVGMSQWGAQTLALHLGWEDREILTFYYSGVEIVPERDIPGV
ncbi:MAG: hypothetical protein IT285_09445 [Bdellovibrionales bacterium]|nr:hypothetical protein [Bdellovibrionales bacterium]